MALTPTNGKTKKPLLVKFGSVSLPIYHTPGRDYDGFTLVYFDESGKRQRLFRSSLDAVKVEAQRIASTLARSQAAVLKLTPEDAALLVSARDTIAPTGRSLEAGVREYVELTQRMGGAPLSAAVDFYLRHHKHATADKRVPDAVPLFLADARGENLGERWLDTLRNRLEVWAPDFQVPVADLTGPLIYAWLQQEQKERGWTGRTRNHYRAAISAFCSWAKVKEYLPRTWNEMELVPKANEDDGEIEVFSPGDLEKILKVILTDRRDLLPFAVLGAFAGPRPSEIQRGTWADLFWDQGEFFVGRGKVRTAGHRVVPIQPALEAWLPKPRPASGPLCTVQDPYHRMQEVAETAKVPWVHDGLRHSYVSYRLALTKNYPQVSAETGTDVKTLQRRYCKPVSQAVAKAWFALRPPPNS